MTLASASARTAQPLDLGAKDWFNVQPSVRQAIEQLSSYVQTQAWQIKELQAALDDRAQVQVMFARKADASSLEQLTKRCQLLADAVHNAKDTSTSLTSRLSTVERRLNHEFDVPTVTQQGATGATKGHVLPSTTTTTFEGQDAPIFGAGQAHSVTGHEGSVYGCKGDSSTYGTIATSSPPTELPLVERLSRVERKLEQLNGACIALEEEGASTLAQVTDLEAELAGQAAGIETRCVRPSDLKEANEQMVIMVEAVSGGVEERLAKASAQLSRTSLEMGQARFDAFQDHVHVEMCTLQDQVAALLVEQPVLSKLDGRTTKVEATLAKVAQVTSALHKDKADSVGVETSMSALRSGVDSIRSTLVASMTHQSEAADASIQDVRDSVQQVSDRVDELVPRVATVEAVGERALEAADEAATGWARTSEQVDAVINSLASKCSNSSVEPLRQLLTQTHHRLDAVTGQVERLCLSNETTIPVSDAAKSAIQAAVSEVRTEARRATETVTHRVAQLETEVASRSAPAAPSPVMTQSRDTSGSRGPAVQRLIEAAIEDFEQRFHEGLSVKLATHTEATTRLSTRLTQELTGAHAMMTVGVQDMSDALNSLRIDVSGQVEAVSSESKTTANHFQHVVDELTSELEQIGGSLKDCVTAEEAQVLAQQMANAAIQRDVVTREQREQTRFQVLLEKVGESLDDKVSTSALHTQLDALKSDAAEKLDTGMQRCIAITREASEATDVRLRGVDGTVDSIRVSMGARMTSLEDTCSQLPTQALLQELRDEVSKKAERQDTLAQISTIQGSLSQKVDRSDVEQRLSRKLDIRTFLASQATHQASSAILPSSLPPAAAMLTPLQRQDTSPPMLAQHSSGASHPHSQTPGGQAYETYSTSDRGRIHRVPSTTTQYDTYSGDRSSNTAVHTSNLLTPQGALPRSHTVDTGNSGRGWSYTTPHLSSPVTIENSISRYI